MVWRTNYWPGTSGTFSSVVERPLRMRDVVGSNLRSSILLHIFEFEIEQDAPFTLTRHGQWCLRYQLYQRITSSGPLGQRLDCGKALQSFARPSQNAGPLFTLDQPYEELRLYILTHGTHSAHTDIANVYAMKGFG